MTDTIMTVIIMIWGCIAVCTQNPTIGAIYVILAIAFILREIINRGPFD